MNQLAAAFRSVIRAWLLPDELAAVDRLNSKEGKGSGICHTHDYCDANVAMDDAFSAVYGRPADLSDERDVDLINEAWESAKVAGFDGGAP